MAYEYADERLRINALRKNMILPKELQVLCSLWIAFEKIITVSPNV